MRQKAKPAVLYLKYFNDFKTAAQSAGARLALPATYGLIYGGSEAATWAKFPGNIYTTPYKSYDAIQFFDN